MPEVLPSDSLDVSFCLAELLSSPKAVVYIIPDALKEHPPLPTTKVIGNNRFAEATDTASLKVPVTVPANAIASSSRVAATPSTASWAEASISNYFETADGRASPALLTDEQIKAMTNGLKESDHRLVDPLSHLGHLNGIGDDEDGTGEDDDSRSGLFGLADVRSSMTGYRPMAEFYMSH